MLGEWFGVYEDDGQTWRSAAWWIYFHTENESDGLAANSWIQTYAQWEDADNPGLYYSLTCNTSYDPSVKASGNYKVDSFVGSRIDTQAVTSGTWGDIGDADDL